jgi:hypothetical protein
LTLRGGSIYWKLTDKDKPNLNRNTEKKGHGGEKNLVAGFVYEKPGSNKGCEQQQLSAYRKARIHPSLVQGF